MDDRAGEGPGNAGHALDLGDDEAAKVIDVIGFGADDDVVGTSDIISLGDAGDPPDGSSYLGSFTDLSLDEDVSLDHMGLPVISVIDTLQQAIYN